MALIVSDSPWDVFYLTCLFSATPSVLSVTDENPCLSKQKQPCAWLLIHLTPPGDVFYGTRLHKAVIGFKQAVA